MASIPSYEFDDAQLKNCKSQSLFPTEIDNDPWVFYHATSSICEKEIDSQGLVWQPSVCSKQELEEIARVYTSMNWAGIGGGGMVVIGSFSLMGDFGTSENKPIYFRESSTRSLIYATSDFAGGESARAVRHAMPDLQRYLMDEAVRQKHYDDQRRECIQSLRLGSFPTRVVHVNMEWLAERIEELRPVWNRCEAIKERHTHGVVYAVRFIESDLPHCSYDGWMGLRCFRALEADRLVAKARITTDEVESVDGQGIDAAMRNLERYENPSGMLFALNKPKQTKNENPGEIPTRPDLRPEFIDPAAGRDEWPELLNEYGTPAAIEYVRIHGHPIPIVKASAELLRA